LSTKTRKKKPLNLRRVKNVVLSLLGLIVIFMAIGFTVARIAIKSVPDYTIDLQNLITQQTGFKVSIGVLDAEISWLVPQLNLANVNVFDQKNEQHLAHLDEIRFKLDWFETLRTQSLVIGGIGLSGLNADIVINKKKQLLFQGFVLDNDIETTLSVENTQKINREFIISDNLKYLINNLDFEIENSRIQFVDQRRSQQLKRFNDFNLRLINNGDQHAFEIKAELPESYGRFIHLVTQVNGDLFDYENLRGEAQLSVEDVNASTWLDDYWGYLGIAANAIVNADIRIAWTALEITDVYSRFNLKNVAIHYLDADVNSWQIDRLNGEMWWQKNKQGWTVDARNLESVRDGMTWPKPSAFKLSFDELKNEFNVQSDFLRIEGVTYLIDMLANAYDAENVWVKLLDQYMPSGDVKYLQLKMSLDDPESLSLQANFDRLSFTLPEMEPRRIDNLRGYLTYKNASARLQLDSVNSQLHFSTLFRDAITIDSLQGAIDIHRNNTGWVISTNQLVIDTPHIKTASRLRVTVSENEPVFMDLTSRFKEGDARYLSNYLPAGIMGKDTLQWLDNAIKQGDITSGGYQFYGKLRDMPFRHATGISLALLDVENVSLNYQKNWPIIQNIDAHLRFENESMLIAASHGLIFDSKIKQARAYIDSFYSPVLDISGQLDAELADIRSYLVNSSLRQHISGYIDNIELTGKGKLDLNLQIPLDNADNIEWGGHLAMQEGGISLRQENYQFTAVTGNLRFSDNYFESENLSARLGGKPLDIKVSTNNQGEDKSYHIKLKGYMGINQLLAPVPSVHAYLAGGSVWDIDINLLTTRIHQQTLVNIKAISQLDGVTSKLPGSLAKKTKQALPALMNINIQPDNHLQFDLQLADDKKILINELNDYWAVDVTAPDIKGRVIVNKQLSPTTPIEADLDYLNLDALLGDAQASEANQTSAAELSSRLPGDIPSLNIKIKNLLWNQLSFNTVDFNSLQNDRGMTINKLDMQSENFDIAANGIWNAGWNQQHTSNFKLDVKIHNLGNMLKQLDITEDIRNTHGIAKLDIRWSDKPDNFSLDNLYGSGRLALSDGVLTKVNAGAGRMLGLFNLKTLFSLDFANQIADGFAFDQAGGSFSISRGNVYSDDLSIESKVADIFLQGRVDLQNQTVDQNIRVRPHVGSTVAFGTTVVAGPAVGGLVYLFQKVFGPDRLSEYEYTVKGSLQDPVVKLLSVPAKENSASETESDF